MPPAAEPSLVVASLEHGTLADADANAHLVPSFAGHVFGLLQFIPSQNKGVRIGYYS